MEFNHALPELGKPWTSTGIAYAPDASPGGFGQSVLLEGCVKTWHHTALAASSNAGGIRSRLTGRERRTIYVRNTSGGVLLPGQVVSWQSGFRGRRVSVKAAAASYDVAGIVDPYWPESGVPADDLFYLFINGPTCVRFVAGAVTLNHGAIASATAGSAQTKGSAYAVGTDLGFILEAKTASAADPYIEVDLKINW